MLENFIRDIPQNMNALINILKKKIGQAKRGKEQIKYLLVLDDVWSVEKWDELKNHLMGINKNGGNGVIVTTPLMASLMSHELELIAKEIAKQCRGVPLVANIIGETMSNIKMNPRAWLEIQKSDVQKNTCRNILTFKIHDSVHDLSLSVSKFDTLLESLQKILTAFTPKLYSLFSEIDVSKKLSKSFTRLKFLKFVCATNISLPKSTAKIYNLQTLRLLGLLSLTFLDKLENLISLKHLYFDRKELQPVNIGNLTCLQVLPIFFVGSKRGRSIKELGSLKELRGELKICDLGGLIIDFEGSNSGSSGYNSEEVMEGLKTHTNLQSLAVSNYQGESFPSWMLKPVGDSNTGLFLLNILIELKDIHVSLLEELDICDCPFLKNVPLTGQCSSLKKPYISKCKTLSKIRDGLSTSIYLKELDLKGCPNLSWIPDLEEFSSLQNLSIDSYKELEVLPITGGCSSLEKLSILGCESLSKIEDKLFSSTCLKELYLCHCSNLSSVPDLEECFSLKILSINSCKELKVLPVIGRYGLFTPSLQNLSIDSCNELEVLSLPGSKIGDGLSTCACLKELGLYNCPNLSSIPNLEGIFSLQSLSINSEGWSCLLPNMLRSNTPLFSLIIVNLLDLIWILDDGLGRLNFLGELAIGARNKELQEFPCLSSFQYLSASLRVLELTGWEKLKISRNKSLSRVVGKPLFFKSLIYQLQLPTALEDLNIWGFHEIEALLESFKNLSSLCCLRIWSCNKLMYLPSVDVMGSFSKLETIDNFMCHQLETRCEKESGPEWSKISHIPHISSYTVKTNGGSGRSFKSTRGLRQGDPLSHFLF
uniref:Disease resistance R13L4/SHOC-2-like LRR domain-containing protein n=1 Tax=Gossypium raimondii TaxID=29730 RepID=A0A0D2RUY7_GOSRA|nr:hypothetical protein B456_006G005700 [Gossypium raimondii]